MPLTPQTILSRNADILHADSGEGTGVMMSLEAGHYYGLDETGFRIWALLEQPRSLAELTDLLMSEFAVDEVTCRADVMEFATQLIDNKLVEIVQT